MSKKIIFGIIALVLLAASFVAFKKVSFRSPIVFLPEAQHIFTEDIKTKELSDTSVVQSIMSDVPEINESLRASENLYGNKVISIENNCEVSPKNIVAYPQEKILIQNNTNKDRELSFDGRTYIVPADGFSIAAFSAVREFSLSCDNRITGAYISIVQ